MRTSGDSFAGFFGGLTKYRHTTTDGHQNARTPTPKLQFLRFFKRHVLVNSNDWPRWNDWLNLAIRLHHHRAKGTKMPLRITEKECAKGVHGKIERASDSGTLLKVEGSLYLEDAELLEKICRDIGERTGQRLTLDLADLSFLDSESASVLCRLKREQNVSLEGLHLFIAKVIELTEAEAMVSEYLANANATECEREFHNDTDRSDTIQRRVAATPERNI